MNLSSTKTIGEALIYVQDPLEYGWEENNDYILATTANASAPTFLVELVSCNSKKCCKKVASVFRICKIAPTCLNTARSVKT